MGRNYSQDKASKLHNWVISYMCNITRKTISGFRTKMARIKKQKPPLFAVVFLLLFSSPYGNRTRVSSVKGTCPNP